MNILFLTLAKIDSLQPKGIYHDLMREFSKHDHHLYIVSPLERREKMKTCLKIEGNTKFLNVKTLNIQKTNFIEKGFSTLYIEKLFSRAVKKYFSDVKFDLVIYSTPPITFTNIIRFIKERDGAKTYLLLKDIFPQNAVDMKLMSNTSFLFKYFRKKEKQLYSISDRIGCMSKANVDFVLKHNHYIDQNKTEINPNSIEIQYFKELAFEEKSKIKVKFKIPENKKTFIYGGNLGKPQGIDFLIATLHSKKDDEDVFFIIVGSGTEYCKIEDWIKKNNPKNVLFLAALPKNEYDLLVQVCDVGLIFLHKDFTIPNYPSRLLSYLEFKMPVLAATDSNTDVGLDLLKNKCGLAVISNDLQNMVKAIDSFVDMDVETFEEMRQNSFRFLQKDFQVKDSYHKIIKSIT